MKFKEALHIYAESIDQKDYKFYVVVGDKIESGWEYKEDAKDQLGELPRGKKGIEDERAQGTDGRYGRKRESEGLGPVQDSGCTRERGSDGPGRCSRHRKDGRAEGLLIRHKASFHITHKGPCRQRAFRERAVRLSAEAEGPRRSEL